MAKIKTQGLDIFAKQFENLAQEVSHINSMALYDAAGIVADEIKSAMNNLPVRDDKEWGTENHKLYGATQSEKNQLIEDLGIDRFREEAGNKSTSIGFTGYVNTPSSRFNGKVPSGMLMQCIEFGTDFRQGTHTITNAMKRARGRAEKAMQDRIETETNKIMQ